MALYKYECDKCGEETEIARPMADRDNDCVCEKCGDKMKRVFNFKSAVVLWRQNNGKIDAQGPTNAGKQQKYTIKDVASHNGWFNGKYSK